MQYTALYPSPLGDLLLAADETGLTGAWFLGQKYFARTLDPDHREGDVPALALARTWLDQYFDRRAPEVSVPLHLTGSEFQLQVWEELRAIPFGRTVTYGHLARTLALRRGVPSLSPQAVGGAVGRNPVSILIPCHRVVGADGSLTGYAGGMDKKRALLALEGLDPDRPLAALLR